MIQMATQSLFDVGEVDAIQVNSEFSQEPIVLLPKVNGSILCNGTRIPFTKNHYMLWNGGPQLVLCDELKKFESDEKVQKLGEIRISSPFPIFTFIEVFLLALVLSEVLRRIIKKTLARFANEIIEPVRELVGVFNDDFDISVAKFVEIHTIALQVLKLRKMDLQKEKALVQVSLARRFAHDVRSPLAALDILKSTISSDVDKAAIDAISKSIRKIRELSHELLKETRAESSSGYELQSTLPTALNQLLNEKRIEYQRFPQLEWSVQITLPDELLCPVDFRELSRTLSNIINNGIESMNGAGRISIIASSNGTNIDIQVLDNGLGFDRSMLVEFPSGKDIRTSKFFGNGIGLNAAREFAKACQGTITISNNITPKIGACVTISIPARTTLESTPTSKPALESI